MRVFVDTSALIALLDEDDARHREASVIFRSLIASDELVTHNYIQVEAVAVATRRLGRGAAQRLVDSLLPAISTVWVDEAIHQAALTAHRTSAGSVSLVDHVSFAIMRRIGIDVAFAFDSDFQQQGFTNPPPASEQERRVRESEAAYGDLPLTEPDIVSVAEIASRAGRPVNTVQSWRRRSGDFPAPIARLAAGPIWSWSSVADWIAARSSTP